MKLLKIFVLCVLIFSGDIYAAGKNFGQKTSFRNASWGKSLFDVMADEGAKFVRKSRDYLPYRGSILGLKTDIEYKFVGDKLYSGKYIIRENYTNKNNYIPAYEKIKDALAKKYGEPKTDDVFWSTEQYKDDPDSWGLAVAVGEHLRFAIWVQGDTNIVLGLTGANLSVDLTIEYSDSELSKLDKAIEEEDLSDL